MDWINSHLLTLITFIPLVGVFLIVLIPKGQDGLMKWVALITTFISLFFCIPLYQGFDMTTSRIQFTELHAWIPFFNINYYFGSVLFSRFFSFFCFLGSDVTSNVLLNWNLGRP